MGATEVASMLTGKKLREPSACWWWSSSSCSLSWSGYVSSSESGRNSSMVVWEGHIWSSASAVWAHFQLVGWSSPAGCFLLNNTEAGTVKMSAMDLSKVHDLWYFS